MGKNYAGLTVTLWVGLSSIHILLADDVIKTVPLRVTTADLERLPSVESGADELTPQTKPRPLPGPMADRD